VTPSKSVRDTGDAPLLVRVGEAGVARTAIARCSELGQTWATIGILAAADDLDALVKAATELEVAVIDSRRGLALAEGINVVEASAAKGLEFDAVVVVEPDQIVSTAADTGTGARILYVSLTRAVQHLTVVHAHDLPLGLSS
jgi:superfamily I DNA/RNA helicase